jgi:hypothetical protein
MPHNLDSRDLKARAIRFGLLKDWYGEEAARTEMAAHTNQGEMLADALERLMKDLGKDDVSGYALLTQNWQDYCGEALVKYLTPEGLKEGILTLTVPHSGLLSMVQPSIELIHNKIRESFGEDFCREIRLISGSGSRRRSRERTQ